MAAELSFEFIRAVVESQSQASLESPIGPVRVAAIDPEWSFDVSNEDTTWKISLTVSVSANDADSNPLCLYSTTVSNYFKVAGGTPDSELMIKNSLIQARGSDLFARAREIISRLSFDSGFGHVVLPPIPDVALFKDV